MKTHATKAHQESNTRMLQFKGLRLNEKHHSVMPKFLFKPPPPLKIFAFGGNHLLSQLSSFPPGFITDSCQDLQ